MKKCLAFLMALAMVLTLCACGSGDKEQEAAEPEETAAPTAVPKVSDWTPDSPVTLIVAAEEGSADDLAARLLVKYAAEYVGESIYLENIPGKDGFTGWDALRGRDADGLTLGYVNVPAFQDSVAANPDTYATTDFDPVCTHVDDPAVIVVRGDDSRFPTLEKLVSFCKQSAAAEDGTPASVLTNGKKGSGHIAAQAFANSAQFTYKNVAKDSAADALTALLAGDGDFCVVRLSDVLALQATPEEPAEGEEKTDGEAAVAAAPASEPLILGVFAPERLADYPDASTLGEAGYYADWLGLARCLVLPAGADKDVIAFYEDAFRQAMADEGYLAEAEKAGVLTGYQDAENTSVNIRKQMAFVTGRAEDFWPE